MSAISIAVSVIAFPLTGLAAGTGIEKTVLHTVNNGYTSYNVREYCSTVDTADAISICNFTYFIISENLIWSITYSL